jgi:hypothetical protein
MRYLALSNQEGQILPDMPTLPKENRHNSNQITPTCNELTNSSGKIRLHKLKKRQHHRLRTAAPPQFSRQSLKRFPPPRIPCAMPKKNDPVHSHNTGS